ncbi:transporter, UIT6 family (TC 9.B.53) [Thalassobaculum litoreum DSM 18839]|uniref:Transporter, UIT6 family (TC 9.B.53) n=2 Tax=Thalassobaculaceae TaxID=2844864 RepID=A0A8G2EV56_9PROT|nr:transporter, UIT6 family (TC 9.B.53) [Thalassobaculum litoreum DSM 18839]
MPKTLIGGSWAIGRNGARHLFRSVPAAMALMALSAGSAMAAGEGAPHLNGAELNLLWVIPFAGILLSIAIFPLVAGEFWHHHFGKISALWALSFLVPFALIFGFDLALYEVIHVGLLEYIPFIILLLSLFTVAGGVRVTGTLRGTPEMNTGILLLGTVIASWMGTTGAAMLLIRPILNANEDRKHKVHVVVFFIFLVANVGGSLTPLGDPPLFLGFLKGVSFFWPTTHMLAPMALVSVILLVLFYGIDKYFWAKESEEVRAVPSTAGEKIALEGKFNILLLAGVVGAVLLSGVWKPGISLVIYHVPWDIQNIVRDVLLLAIAFISWKVTSLESRLANGFTWFPILEVAKLFAGIFLTIIPAIAILKAGTDGSLRDVVSAVSTETGEPVNMAYFWLTGILSSFLDNAPTYLVFFNTAGGDAQELMGPMANTLLAISAGAVFMGANSYIGNAPNFMVKAIAEERGIAMPSFFGYMIWSGLILMPIFLLISFVFFA